MQETNKHEIKIETNEKIIDIVSTRNNVSISKASKTNIDNMCNLAGLKYKFYYLHNQLTEIDLCDMGHLIFASNFGEFRWDEKLKTENNNLPMFITYLNTHCNSNTCNIFF